MEPIDLRDTEDLSMAYIDDFFRPFVVRGGALAIVNRLIGDRVGAAWCAGNSYHHANGFVKVVLGESEAGRRLVWHRWQEPGWGPDADLHNHRWDFVSYVCRGAVGLEDFEERSAGGVKAVRYLYRSPGSSSSFSLERVGPRVLERTAEREVPTGCFYYQPHATVHRACSTVPGTSTLLVQGVVETDQADVYLDESVTLDRLRRAAQRVSVSEVVQLLAQLRDDLNSGGHPAAMTTSP